MENRWSDTDVPRGDAYDARWRTLQAEGVNVHGEADCVERLVHEFELGCSVIDAGCGTGRVAIELAARGFRVLGVDADLAMLERARVKAPHLEWTLADLAHWEPPGEQGALPMQFDVAVLAGNVMIFVAAGTEQAVLESTTRALHARGIVVAGFQVRPDRLSLLDYDVSASRAGLELLTRFATWQGDPYVGGDYAVSVHRRLTA